MMAYSLVDVADALGYRVAEATDPDTERAADLHRALRQTDSETRRVLELWASGYSLREISERLWQVNSPNRTRRLVSSGLREVRSLMNGSLSSDSDGEQISK